MRVFTPHLPKETAVTNPNPPHWSLSWAGLAKPLASGSEVQQNEAERREERSLRTQAPHPSSVRGANTLLPLQGEFAETPPRSAMRKGTAPRAGRRRTYRRSGDACCLGRDARALLGVPKPLRATGSAGEGLVRAGDDLDLCAGKQGRHRRDSVCSGT